ncbi:hypothetical protein BLNAU_4307 [Blattamonas nauphoetae]|uniref:Uncharacterized protein n=1 Tax=Blattamonas nauphoetae TaxID=2049346 RepID=A0ABQ9YAA4_9EUKA|nr:hypothetical protein BLNAU_4307 [Blattamonas nauphoetae]
MNWEREEIDLLVSSTYSSSYPSTLGCGDSSLYCLIYIVLTFNILPIGSRIISRQCSHNPCQQEYHHKNIHVILLEIILYLTRSALAPQSSPNSHRSSTLIKDDIIHQNKNLSASLYHCQHLFMIRRILSSNIADLVHTIPNDHNSRLQQNSQSSRSPLFFVPIVIEDTERIEVEISSWDFLSSASDPLLSFPRFNVFRAKFPKITSSELFASCKSEIAIETKTRQLRRQRIEKGGGSKLLNIAQLSTGQPKLKRNRS